MLVSPGMAAEAPVGCYDDPVASGAQDVGGKLFVPAQPDHVGDESSAVRRLPPWWELTTTSPACSMPA